MFNKNNNVKNFHSPLTGFERPWRQLNRLPDKTLGLYQHLQMPRIKQKSLQRWQNHINIANFHKGPITSPVQSPQCLHAQNRGGGGVGVRWGGGVYYITSPKKGYILRVFFLMWNSFEMLCRYWWSHLSPVIMVMDFPKHSWRKSMHPKERRWQGGVYMS